jgi:hypothetical protein
LICAAVLSIVSQYVVTGAAARYGMVWYGMVCVDDVGRLLAWLCFVFSSTLFVIVAFRRADGSREG